MRAGTHFQAQRVRRCPQPHLSGGGAGHCDSGSSCPESRIQRHSSQIWPPSLRTPVRSWAGHIISLNLRVPHLQCGTSPAPHPSRIKQDNTQREKPVRGASRLGSMPTLHMPSVCLDGLAGMLVGQLALPSKRTLLLVLLTGLPLAYIFFCLENFFFFGHLRASGILVSQPGIEPMPPAVKAQSPNHWTGREVPSLEILNL